MSTISLSHPNCNGCKLIRRTILKDGEFMHALSNPLILCHLDNPLNRNKEQKGSINVFHTPDGLITLDQGSNSKSVFNSNYLKWTTPLGLHLRQYLLEASDPSPSSPRKYLCFTCSKASPIMFSCNQCKTGCCIECVKSLKKHETVGGKDVAWLCVHPNCKQPIAVRRNVYEAYT